MSGTFWLFGGMGYDSAGASGRLNDLWRGYQLRVIAVEQDSEDFSSDVTSSTPGDTTGWTPFSLDATGRSGSDAGGHVADYDAVNGALRVTISSGTGNRVNGWITGNSEWLAYSTVGTANCVRGKFHMFRAGQYDTGDLNQVPNMRMRLATRFAVNSMLEVFNHLTGDPTGTNAGKELVPSSNPASPSVYRVDFDPIDVPAMGTAGEGITRGFEAYSLEPQENGAVEMTESSIAIYGARALADDSTWMRGERIYQCSASDAGDLKVFNSLTDGPFYKKFILLSPGVLGTEVPLDGSTDPQYYETASGVTLTATLVPTDRVGLVVREFNEMGANTERIRVEPGRQYKVRFHVTSASGANTNPQFRMRARALKFMWSQKLEIGGALAAGNANNAIAQQALPGVGSQNPDQETPGEWGGWYTLIMHTPMSAEIQATQNYIASQPGPGADSPSMRDVKLGVDLIDTLSGNAASVQEVGWFTVDRIELRTFDLMGD
jgi:hypothetical protein